ncbi:MAG: hypothetical protein OEY20_04090 [Gemmatimonadota bacterium]|nr:hypothetical protein [Gemmatimonadota bacterium]MDH4349903.1 hypothetical protein [Gemmatimonadota bacterium]MDH5196408.1 hypothetical protein [Gemmatimonadota bacterium]
MRGALGTAAVAAGLAASVVSAHAQDAHYWTHQYGTRATLLGGAVIGSVLEVSATYYNPGALALLEDAALIATSRVLEYGRLNLRDPQGDGGGLTSTRFDPAPGFFGGLLPFRLGNKHVFGYSGFTRQRFQNEMVSAGTLTGDALPGGGPETVASLIEISQDLSESWYGLSWGYALGRRAGIGLSTFVTYRSQRGLSRVELQVADTIGQNAVSRSENFAKMSHIGLLLKGGIAWEWLGASLGLTVTTPRLGLRGSGDIRYNRTLAGADIDGDGEPDPLAAVTYQNGLPVTYRSSWAIGIGGMKQFGATRLHVSSEWYAPVDSFPVFDPAPFLLQPTGDTIRADLSYALQGVFNVGLGVEHAFRPWLSGFASFQTNFSARPAGAPTSLSLSSWDAYYVTAGTAFRFQGSDVTLGLSYGRGADEISYAPGQPPDPIQDLIPETLGVRYRSIRFILAFSL